MDRADVALLRDAGVAAVDVAGAGGTNWALDRGAARPSAPARWRRAFADWGVPTADALRRRRVAAGPGLPVLASGGVRDGVGVAKCLALGAVGRRAGPAVPARRAGGPGRRRLRAVVDQLRIADLGRRARPRRRALGARAPRGDGMSGRRRRGRPRRPRRRAAAAGRGPRRRRRRAARAPGRPRLPAARRRLHLGHGPVARDDALGPRGDVRGGRPGPPPRGRPRRLDPLLPDPLGRGGATTSTSCRRPSGCGRRSRGSRRATRPPRRRSWPRCGRSTRTASSRRPPAVPARARPRRLRAPDGPPGSRAAAARARRAPLPPPARARGVLVPLALHRRRPLPRAGDLRRARLPPGPGRGLVRPTAAV